MAELIESNLFAVLMAAASFISVFSVMRSKLTAMEARVEKIEKTALDNFTKIGRRDEEMLEIHRRLDNLDGMRLDARLTQIETDLSYIRAMLEKFEKGGSQNV